MEHKARKQKGKKVVVHVEPLDEDEVDALLKTQNSDAVVIILSQQLQGKSNALIKRAIPPAMRRAVVAEPNWPATDLVLRCYERLLRQINGPPDKMEVLAVRLLLETLEGLATGGERWGGDPVLSFTPRERSRARGEICR